MRKSLFALLFFFQALHAQDVKWNAHWIMHPTVQPQDHAMILFRKNFELKAQPDSFIIHLSADNHYRLFVNGRFVLRGPARGDISHWFYETVDIAPFLTIGKNTLAAEVINWGPKRSFTYFSQMTSFILQGDGEAGKLVNTYGESWKCIRNEGIAPKHVDWMMDRSTIDFGLYVGNPTDSVIGSRYPWGWEQPGYDDATWLPAKWCDVAGGRGEQHAGGILYSGGKLLVPRETGILKETPENFGSLRRIEGMEYSGTLPTVKDPLIIPANSTVTLLLDMQYETMGYPEMQVSGGRNARIQCMYAENLIVMNKAPKGHRNDIEGKRMVGLKDVFLPDGGAKRLFKPTYLRAFRYVQLDIVTDSDPLTIHHYYNMASKAPIEKKAVFETGLPLTDWIMDAGWRTVSICAQDMLLSDAAYEQMQYTGDSRVHNLSLLTLSGDDRLTRNSLVQFDQSRIPEGLTYACYPNPFHLIIPSYSLIWIDQVHDYMMWKDDKEFIAGFEPGIEQVLGWYERRLQPNGLLGKIQWWAALAWPRHYNNGVPPGIYKGNNTLYSLHYAYTLRHAAEIFAFTGKMAKADQYRKTAENICQAVNSLCKNPEGFYTEYPDSSQISQITNIMAILAEAVKDEEARKLMEKLLEPKDWFGQVDLFLHLYLFEAMNKTGFGDQFMAQLTEWQLMKDRGLTTFVEVPLEWGEENQRSECHPWSSSPNYFFFRTVCGITPLEPGHRKVLIAPSFGEFKKIHAVYPNALGEVKMNLEKTSSGVKGEIIIPDGMHSEFQWQGKRIMLKPGNQKINL